MKKGRAVPLILALLISMVLGGAYLIVAGSPSGTTSDTAAGGFH